MAEVRVLTSEDVEGLVEPGEVVDAVREGYRQRGEGAPARPRTRLTGRDPPGMLTGYSAVLPESGGMGGYMYSAGFGASDAWFVLPLFDAETGETKAIVDGSRLNPVKTGAASAVAVDELARDDAATLGLIGSGNQAYGQLRCLATVRDLDEVRVFSTTRDHRRAFAEHARHALELDVRAVETAQAAVEGAGIVVTATKSGDPVFDGRTLEAGAHVTAMGQYHPRRREVDGRTVARATYVPDLRERVHRDSGELLLAQDEGLVGPDPVHAELGAVVAGVAAGRTSADEVTMFDSGGTGIETVAAAELVHERAVEAGVGETVEFTSASEGMERPW
jgi:alanine dehydrogenase